MKRKTKKVICAALAVLMVGLVGGCKQREANTVQQPVADDAIYQFTVLDGDSNTVDLSAYEGKVLLIVNTATQCGFTPQYEELQALYTRLHANGLEVLDFPCNQFGEQAPGSNAEIAAFCTGTYNTTFAQMCKIDVNGENEAPVFAWLKSKLPFGGFDTTDARGKFLDQMFRAEDPNYDKSADIKWNFTKFVVDRQGRAVARFEPTDPMSKVASCIEGLL